MRLQAMGSRGHDGVVCRLTDSLAGVSSSHSPPALCLQQKLRDIKWEDDDDHDRTVKGHVRAARKTVWLVATGRMMVEDDDDT